uniref:CSON001822 protein n=1 Tax=Culicoides sonorensis TaxID=179676 RepID=A0A336LRD5_CULSO
MNYSGTDYFVEYMFGFQLIPALGSPCNQILYQNAFGCEYHNRFGVSSKKALKSIGRVWVEAASNFCGISTSLIDGSTEDLHRLLERENELPHPGSGQLIHCSNKSSARSGIIH